MKSNGVIILCVDGLDPNLLKKFVKQGYLPNFKELIKNGRFAKLSTVNPPQSPVVWKSFITGKDPVQHGYFDFLTRDPGTYFPRSLFDVKRPKNPSDFWHTKPFNNIKTELIFLPTTFPPTKINGRMVSGMGTPDLLGTQGAFQLFSSNITSIRSGIIQSISKNGSESARLTGPEYKFLKKYRQSSIPISIKTKLNNKVQINVAKNILTLKVNEYSDWVNVVFKVGLNKKISGITKFYVLSVKPDLNIVAMPINIDPTNAATQISFPSGYVKDIVKMSGGYFHTLGLPHTNSALREKAMTFSGYLKQSENIYNEREKIILEVIKKTSAKLIIPYIGSVDSVQHMFWENMHKSKDSYKQVIQEYYKKVDGTLGKITRDRPQDTLVVISDHGFGNFDYEVNLNTILYDIGFLKLKKDGENNLLGNVDWAKTQAYAIGFNSIYINLKGREANGIVKKSEYEKTLRKLNSALLKYKMANKKVFYKIHSPKKPSGSIPDAVVGYNLGYRTSWETVVGIIPPKPITKRSNAWSGDHMFDADLIPGVFLTNNKNIKIPTSIKNVLKIIRPLF